MVVTESGVEWSAFAASEKRSQRLQIQSPSVTYQGQGEAVYLLLSIQALFIIAVRKYHGWR